MHVYYHMQLMSTNAYFGHNSSNERIHRGEEELRATCDRTQTLKTKSKTRTAGYCAIAQNIPTTVLKKHKQKIFFL